MKHHQRILLIIIIIVLITILVSRIPAQQETPSRLGLPYNLFCQQGDWIYYSDNDAIYKVKTNGQEKTKLCDDSTGWIQVDQDRLYYINEEHNHNIYSIKTDGTDKTMVSAKRYGGNDANKLFVSDGWIYFTNHRIFKMRIDGSERENLVGFCQDMSLSGDWIYYLTDMKDDGYGLYRIRTDGTEEKELIGECGAIDYDNEWIYCSNADFSDENDKGIYKIKYDRSEKHKLTEDTAIQLKVVDDWVYYVKDGNDSGIYKVRTDGSEKIQVTKDGAMFLDIWDDHVLYLNIDFNDGKLSMNLSTVTLNQSKETDPVIADIIKSVISDMNNPAAVKLDN